MSYNDTKLCWTDADLADVEENARKFGTRETLLRMRDMINAALAEQVHYFATDGNYGDATDILIADTSSWTRTEWDAIEEATGNDRVEIARAICERKGAHA